MYIALDLLEPLSQFLGVSLLNVPITRGVRYQGLLSALTRAYLFPTLTLELPVHTWHGYFCILWQPLSCGVPFMPCLLVSYTLLLCAGLSQEYLCIACTWGPVWYLWKFQLNQSPTTALDEILHILLSLLYCPLAFNDPLTLTLFMLPLPGPEEWLPHRKKLPSNLNNFSDKSSTVWSFRYIETMGFHNKSLSPCLLSSASIRELDVCPSHC